MLSLVRFVYGGLVRRVTYQFFNLLWTIICIYFHLLNNLVRIFYLAEVIRSFFSCAIISFNVLNVLYYVLFHCPVLCHIQFHQLEVPWTYVRPLTHVHLIFINIGFDDISISETSISAVRINISNNYLNSYKICRLRIILILDGTFGTM